MKEKLLFPKYIDNLQSEGKYWFFRSVLLRDLQLTPNAFKKAVSRLIIQHRLAHIRSDFYTIVPLEYRAISCLPASWFIDAFMGYLKQPYYVGLLSAAALHGAAHQQPMVFQVITDKPVRPITVGQVRLEFHYKKKIEPQFYQSIKTASGNMNVSTPEMTAFDLVRYANASGQLHHVATVLAELSEQLNEKKLTILLENDSVEVITTQRLGYLLEKIESCTSTELLHAELKKRKYFYRLLFPKKKIPALEKNSKWRILVNEHIEVDDL
jgi:predicted transcriptional regulator of viral defense system